MGAMFAVAANNVPSSLVDFFHGIQVAITFALMTNVVQFAWWTRKGNRAKNMTHCQRYGPVYVLMLSTCLVMVQPTCMLVISSWGINNFFFDGDSNPNALVPNTTTGWLIQVFCTYVGYILLFTGVFWATQLHKKIAKKWRQIRGDTNVKMVYQPSVTEGRGSHSKKESESYTWERVGSNNDDLWGTLFEESKQGDQKDGPNASLIAGAAV
uniref:Uncharacterized protein n=1 Tax=Lotharella oceanica TaxID=641309 RepID=A0A7S2XGH8_9EUKA|mmetsp:Transcript_620/g.1161  ORF Transcript_620/g.1161 Transcript_620/m.1161 type:complete len:211 (+) Transcript_620:274-906(+)